MTDPWQHVSIEFADPATAEATIATHLVPVLAAAQETGLLHQWWYVRKRPQWRLRFRAREPDWSVVRHALDELVAHDHIAGWARGVYEPETIAFGGRAGMNIAHEFFHHDSHHLLARVATRTPAAPSLGRRETSILLCGALLRSAGLDWFEQGDVWAKVTQLRPTDSSQTLIDDRAAGRAAAMRRLMTVDARAACGACGPLAGAKEWVAAFETTGQALRLLDRDGRLDRGLRAVLAHHIIFHANRAGLPADDQATIAHLAVHTVFATPLSTVSTRAATPTTDRVNEVTNIKNDTEPTAEQLRDHLVDTLKQKGVVRSPQVEQALRRVPRHLFVPGVPLDQAYADEAVYTKTDAAGTSISAASQPWIVAMMLEQLAPQHGQRVLEAGAGTGYNAALIAAIVGDTGHVTTIDVDEDLVDGARKHLAAAGSSNVHVLLADGALGHPDAAPYDRIIATVGAWEPPTPWLNQLAHDGRLVVPLRLRGTASRSIVFERDHDGWTSRGSELAVFMPLRGIGDDARRTVALTDEQDVTLQVHKDQTVDPATLAGVLRSPRHETWTGVLFPPMVPYEWMDLWLCCRLDNPLMRMNVQPAAVEREQLTPMFSWGSMATVNGADLAYLTVRPAPMAADGRKLYEVGVIGHGPNSAALADHVAQEIVAWDQTYRARTVHFAIPDSAPEPDPGHGQFLLPRPHHPITVTWQ